MIVRTKSGHDYKFTFLTLDREGRILWAWQASQSRDHDSDGSAKGIALFDPEVGKSLTLCWHHPERGLQVRITTQVIQIEQDEVEAATWRGDQKV